MFPGHSVPHPSAAIYYWLEKSCHILGCLQCLRATGIPPPRSPAVGVAGLYVQETCCERFSAAASIRGIRQPVWLSHSGLSFHILDLGASDCLCPKGSSLGMVRLESLMSSAVHTATLPWLPQGQPPLYPCPSAPWLPQSPCMALGAELQLVLSLQAPEPPGYEQDEAQACICI